MAVSYFDVWKKKMDNNGGNVTQSRVKSSKDFFNNNFIDDPSYKLATLRKRDTTILDSDLDTRVINVDTDVYKKKIYVRPDTNIEAGDYIIYPNKTYLVLSTEDNLISPYANSTFCNYTLKWMIDGEYFETQAIVTNNTKYTLGVSNQSVGITEASGMFGAIISYTDIAKKIPLGQRFIVNGQAWEATQLDHSSTPNILSILLGESSKSTEYDDMENEIADAYLYSYAITLNSVSETLVETSIYQLVPTVTNNGVVVSNPTNITYTSSDESIATVNSNGLVTTIGVGNCTITASIGSVSATLDLVVTAKTVTPVVSYGYTWSNGTNLKTYMSSTISLTKTIDSVTSPLVATYSLDSIGTTLLNAGNITITKKSDYSYQIKNVNINTIKSFVITFTDSDGTVIVTQTINLSGI